MKKLAKKEMKAIKGAAGDGPCILTACVSHPPVCPNGGSPEFVSFCKTRSTARYECCPKVGD
jgi:hypothetical protein